MKSTFSRILYGGDYNPNQWPKEIWEKDIIGKEVVEKLLYVDPVTEEKVQNTA